MQNIDVVIGECNTILFAFFLCIGEKDYRTRMTGSTGSAGFLKVERFFEVERWKGEMVWCGVVWCGVVWCGVVWCGVK